MTPSSQTLVGIIGGTNGLGAALAAHWRAHTDYKILVAGRKTALKPMALVAQAQVVVLAVPLESMLQTIQELVPLGKKNTLWIDISSTKEAVVNALAARTDQYCGLHPLFGPLPNLTGHKVVQCLSPEISAENRAHLVNLLAEFSVKELSPRQHDDWMATLQGIPHFTNWIMGEACRELVPDFQKFIDWCPPVYQKPFLTMARFFSGSSPLYPQIAVSTPQMQKTAQTMAKLTQALSDQVQKGDSKALHKNYQAIQQYLSLTLCQQAKQLINQSLLVPAKSNTAGNRIKKNLNSCLIFGQPGSHTALAAEQFSAEKCESFQYTESLSELFQALNQGLVSSAVVPYENTVHGVVAQVLDELHKNPAIHAIDSHQTPIKQALLGVETVDPKNLRLIHSHYQALHQSQTWLKAHCPQARWNFVTSTTMGADLIQKIQDPTQACIGAEQLAEKYGLTILAKSISPRKNATRFLKLAKTAVPKNTDFLSLVFWFDQDRPGNLLQALQFFAAQGLNLTRLDSRRDPEQLGRYLFFVDLESSAQAFLAKEKDWQKVVDGWRLLGGF